MSKQKIEKIITNFDDDQEAIIKKSDTKKSIEDRTTPMKNTINERYDTLKEGSYDKKNMDFVKNNLETENQRLVWCWLATLDKQGRVIAKTWSITKLWYYKKVRDVLVVNPEESKYFDNGKPVEVSK